MYKEWVQYNSAEQLRHIMVVSVPDRSLVGTAALYWEDPDCTWRSNIATENLYAFPRFRLANSRILSENVKRPHHFPFFASHYSWIIPSFNFIYIYSFWMGDDVARHHPHRTHDLRSGSQDHHPSTNSVQKTICCNLTSNAPDDGPMYPKHVELRIHQ